mmetsp:Transcript_4315/g.8808  ORF Transcript_4315/g.8808 Transcript_4315/m.8808 type:complete len:223 (-) Transcript_4315:35-703(-)
MKELSTDGFHLALFACLIPICQWNLLPSSLDQVGHHPTVLNLSHGQKLEIVGYYRIYFGLSHYSYLHRALPTEHSLNPTVSHQRLLLAQQRVAWHRELPLPRDRLCRQRLFDEPIFVTHQVWVLGFDFLAHLVVSEAALEKILPLPTLRDRFVEKFHSLFWTQTNFRYYNLSRETCLICLRWEPRQLMLANRRELASNYGIFCLSAQVYSSMDLSIQRVSAK